jgi:hypothetical protein
VNPNCPLPQALLNFVIKHFAGVVLYYFQKQVMKVSQDHQCTHAHRIRDNKEFYSTWLLPKLRAFCELRHWEQPVIVSIGEDGQVPVSVTRPSVQGMRMEGNGEEEERDDYPQAGVTGREDAVDPLSA